MEFGFRASEEREPPFFQCPPPRSRVPPPRLLSSSPFFTDQALQGGYIGSDGPIDPRPSLEELERELLEERIKEEILALRLARRRMIEEEARRAMEMERAMMMERVQLERFSDRLPIMSPRDRLGPRLIRRHDGFDQQLAFRYGTEAVMEKEMPLAPSCKSEVSTINEIKTPNQKFAASKGNDAQTASGISGLKLSKEWCCALCQVSLTTEEQLNEHLKGKKHLANAAQLGPSKKPSCPTLFKNRNNKVGGGRKVCIQVNGKMQEVMERGSFLWCMPCNIKCNSRELMVGHLLGKKHLLLKSKEKGRADDVKER